MKKTTGLFPPPIKKLLAAAVSARTVTRTEASR